MRWELKVNQLQKDYDNLIGDILICAGLVAYLGAFTPLVRTKCTAVWTEWCGQFRLARRDKFSMEAILGNPVDIRAWRMQGLPSDSFSLENAIAIEYSEKWPLLIDPQGQAQKWIIDKEKRNELKILRQEDKNLLHILETAVQIGTPVLIENVQEELDPMLDPLLQKKLFKQAGVLCIRLGESTVEYSDRFQLYMTTKIRNPHYMPDVAIKVHFHYYSIRLLLLLSFFLSFSCGNLLMKIKDLLFSLSSLVLILFLYFYSLICIKKNNKQNL